VRRRWDWEGEGCADERIVPAPYEAQVEDMGVYLDATDLQGVRETLFVNASIMDLAYRPVNAPWVVDLMLPLPVQEQ